ncbi:MAG: hypothetical protein IJF69_01680 [Clostridia bacterium]|nr:hypothetical protein [Clostridia bacterium]
MITNIFIYLLLFAFVILPVAAVVFFIISLILFIMGCCERKNRPEKMTKPKFKKRLVRLITSFIVAFVVIGAELAVLVAFANAIAYM